MAKVEAIDAMNVSIIIPCKKIDDYIKRCEYHCVNVLETIPNCVHEILVINDEVCPGYPAAKRNYAMVRARGDVLDRKSTRLNSSHSQISYAVFCLKKKREPASLAPRGAPGAADARPCPDRRPWRVRGVLPRLHRVRSRFFFF